MASRSGGPVRLGGAQRLQNTARRLPPTTERGFKRYSYYTYFSRRHKPFRSQFSTAVLNVTARRARRAPRPARPARRSRCAGCGGPSEIAVAPAARAAPPRPRRSRPRGRSPPARCARRAARARRRRAAAPGRSAPRGRRPGRSPERSPAARPSRGRRRRWGRGCGPTAGRPTWRCGASARAWPSPCRGRSTRALRTGTMACAPSSVAFSTTRSIFWPLGTACAIVIASSVSTGSRSSRASSVARTACPSTASVAA